jgi:RNA polymerase sigma-70 factor (ECF subfamily)
MARGTDDFDDAFRSLYPLAFKAAYRVLGSVAEAEDVAADAMARALVRWPRVRRLDHPEGWVVRVAINLAIDATRRRRAIPRTLDPVADPAEAAALRVTLAIALAKLPRRQREVIALRYLAGMSEHEVADAMGIADSSVKEHAKRAIASLRRRVGPDFEEESLAID